MGDTSVRVSGTFRVEAYRAPQFRVDVSAPATHLAAGDPVKAQVLARYLFGAALAEAPTRWTVARRTLEFRPPRHDGFDFGIQTWWWDDNEPSPSGDVFATGRGKTDALGGLAIDAGKAEATADRTWSYDVEAEVEDLSRQTVADRAQLVVHPASFYAGVRRAPGFAEARKPISFELVAVTPTGERREATVAIELRRREWKWIKKKVAGDRWTTVSEPVEELVGRCCGHAGRLDGVVQRHADPARLPRGPGQPQGRARARPGDAHRPLRHRRGLGGLAARRHRPDRSGPRQGDLRGRADGARAGEEPLPQPPRRCSRSSARGC